MNRLSKKRRHFLLAITGIISIITLVFMVFLSASGKKTYLIGNVYVSINAIMGCVQALMLMLCVQMVCIDCEIGSVLSYGALGFMLFNAFLGLIKTGSLLSLPGMIYSLSSAFSIHIIAKQIKQINRDSITDLTTGLHNRRSYLQQMADLIAIEKPFYVVFISINNLRSINDHAGYIASDDVIKEVATRIDQVVDKRGTTCVISDDIFAVILSYDYDPWALSEEIIERVTQRIQLSIDGGLEDVFVTGNTGITQFPEDAVSVEVLNKYAEVALHHAIEKGPNKACYFNKSMENELFKNIELEIVIKNSLEHDYFYLVYQPQFYTADHKLRGFETLLRLQLPDGTHVSPADFVPVAEKTDLINEIDRYVLKRAMREFKQMMDGTDNMCVVSVNVSAKEMSTSGYASVIIDIMQEEQFPPECLEVEITEYSIAESMITTVANILRLKQEGVKIALDDFGTGYTSLAQLINLPIDLLKIDKSLIDEIVNDHVNRDFVDAIIYMGHLMNCEVIAEGVENDDQLKLLGGHECDFIQGYVWGKPLSRDAATELMHSQQ